MVENTLIRWAANSLHCEYDMRYFEKKKKTDPVDGNHQTTRKTKIKESFWYAMQKTPVSTSRYSACCIKCSLFYMPLRYHKHIMIALKIQYFPMRLWSEKLRKSIIRLFIRETLVESKIIYCNYSCWCWWNLSANR